MRPRRWGRAGLLGSVAFAAICLPFVAGCGGGSGSGKPKPQEQKGQPATKRAAGTAESADGKGEAPAPKGWADRVAGVYLDALKQTVALLDPTPPAAEALPKLKAIREACIEALVPLGRERDAMGSAEKSKADSQLMTRLIGLERAEAFRKFEKIAAQSYGLAAMKGDEEKELRQVLASLKLTPRYAQFDALKKQEPKEAERLGIK